MTNPIKTLAAITLASLSCSAQAAVNDLLPLDFIARPDGTVLTALYAIDRRYDGPYTDGRKSPDGNISMQIAALRVGRFVETGGITLAFGAFVPWAASELTFNTNGLAPRMQAFLKQQETESHGMGDLRLGVTAWLINAPAQREYFTINSTVILPTGSYDENRALNIGDNRWTVLLGAGWNKPLSEKFVFELAPEIAFYSNNRDYLNTHTLEKDPTFALSATLRYRATADFHVFGGMQVNRGGETSLDGIARDDAPNTDRASLGALYITPAKHIWTLRYSRDTRISNGYRTQDELALRWQVPF